MGASETEVLRNLIFRSIQKETRLSENQVARLRWSMIDGDIITTAYHRKIKISRELEDALVLLPRRKSGTDLLFFGSTSLLSEDNHRRIVLARSDDPEPKRRYAIFALKSHKHIDKSAMVC